MPGDSVQSLQFSPDHPCLAGHFPGKPIVPGALLLLRMKHIAEAYSGGLPLASVDSVKFLSPALPGERLEVHCSPRPVSPAGLHRLKLLVMRDEEIICEASVSLRPGAAGPE